MQIDACLLSGELHWPQLSDQFAGSPANFDFSILRLLFNFPSFSFDMKIPCQSNLLFLLFWNLKFTNSGMFNIIFVVNIQMPEKSRFSVPAKWKYISLSLINVQGFCWSLGVIYLVILLRFLPRFLIFCNCVPAHML